MALQTGDNGPDVAALQEALEARGFNPGSADGSFGPATRTALIAFQKSAGLDADGIAGVQTLEALGIATVAAVTVVSMIPGVTVDMAAQIVAGAPRANVEAHLPHVLNALVQPQLADRQMIMMALGTIRAETGSFRPISEGVSKFNTSPGGQPFDLYDNRTSSLGNIGPPDGATFKGRGFIQLTGRDNYRIHGLSIGLGDRLLTTPDLANDPEIAGKLLAAFLKAKENDIRNALVRGDLATARKLVNGGSHGLDEFEAAIAVAQRVLPESIDVVSQG